MESKQTCLLRGFIKRKIQQIYLKSSIDIEKSNKLS